MATGRTKRPPLGERLLKAMNNLEEWSQDKKPLRVTQYEDGQRTEPAMLTLQEWEQRRAKSVGSVHPGEILRSEFLQPLSMTEADLARRIYVDAELILEIVQGQRGISADMAHRLGRFFKTSPELWLGLQYHYEEEALRQADPAQYEKIQPYDQAA